MITLGLLWHSSVNRMEGGIERERTRVRDSSQKAVTVEEAETEAGLD